jgi:hypothetical protein
LVRIGLSSRDDLNGKMAGLPSNVEARNQHAA